MSETMNTKQAADRWELTQRTVQKYCRNGKIPGAERINGNWFIPIDAVRPLNEEKIVRILQLTLRLSNRNDLGIDYASLGFREDDLVSVYRYLEHRGYFLPLDGIEPFRIPYEAKLSEKAYSLVYAKAKLNVKIEGADVASIVKTLAAIISAIAPLIAA